MPPLPTWLIEAEPVTSDCKVTVKGEVIVNVAPAPVMSTTAAGTMFIAR
jgi:hypothetical protein